VGCDEKMKVLHLISGGDTGGAKTHVITLLKALKDINVEVKLLCIMEGVFTKEAEEIGIPIKIIPQVKRYDISVNKKIIDYINHSDFDLIHCHGARANYIAMFIMDKIKPPMLTTLHSDYKLDFKDNLHKKIIYTPINALALRRFKNILCVTKAFKNMLIQRGFKKERIDVIYNGIDFNEEIVLYNRADFYNKCSIKYDEKKIYVGIAARLDIVKGVKYFIEMAVKLCRKYNNVEFIIAGEGSEFNKFKQYISDNNLKDRIHLVGFLRKKVINSFYNSIDVNMLTSLSESFPYALLEGARLKKATVSTAVGGIVEMIKDGENGFLVKPQDVDQLCEKVSILIENKQLRDKFGENFYSYAKENFSSEKMAATHKKIYQKIIKENS